MDLPALAVDACLFLALYFEVFLLISFFEKKPAQKTTSLPKHYPSVTILVPCWNEEKTIGSTLKSLLALSYPKELLSIMVVDDGSTDGTPAVAKAFALAHPDRIRYYHKENGGKWTALNFGIQKCTTDLIGCLDADSFVAKDALLEVAKKFEEHPDTMAVVPAMQVHRQKNLLELMQTVEYTFGIFYKKMFDNLAAISVLPGPFSIYRKEVFQVAGLFRHAHNTEDMEMAFRMHEHGLKIVNAHTAIVYTNVPSTVRALIKQRVRWSQGFLQNSQDYSYMYFNKRFGHFGMLVLPVGLAGFAAGLYMAGYAFYTFASSLLSKIATYYTTGIPLNPSIPSMQVEWFYINTSMTVFLAVAVLGMTLFAILMGRRIASANFGVGSLLSYFLLHGFIAPLWLARAAWGAVLAQESKWR